LQYANTASKWWTTSAWIEKNLLDSSSCCSPHSEN